MSIHERDWYRIERPRGTARHSEIWRACRGLSIVAVAVLGLLVFGKTLLRQGGVVTPFGSPARAQERRSAPDDPAGMLIPPPATRAPTATYRCVVDGVVVYEGPADCRPAMEAPRRESAPAERAGELTPYQREMLRSADARIARQNAAARAELQATAQQTVGANECSALAAEILALDARARQPNSGSTQDSIRARRQDVRSRQAALHC